MCTLTQDATGSGKQESGIRELCSILTIFSVILKLFRKKKKNVIKKNFCVHPNSQAAVPDGLYDNEVL